MSYAIEQIARVVHEANRVIQVIDGDPAPSPPWDEAPDWQRQPLLDEVGATIAALLAGEAPDRLAALGHERWRAAKVRDGWVYGPVKSPAAKTHPCLVPWADLPEGQRRKDLMRVAIVRELAA